MFGGHVPPAQQAQTFGGDDFLEQLLAFVALGRVRRQEHRADAVFAGTGQRDFHFAARFLQERMRHLEQDARAVAGIDLGMYSCARCSMRTKMPLSASLCSAPYWREEPMRICPVLRG